MADDERRVLQAALLNTFESSDAQIMEAGLPVGVRELALQAVDGTAVSIPANQEPLREQLPQQQQPGRSL